MRGRTLFIAGLLTAAFAGQAAAQVAGKITDSPHDLSTGGAELDKNEICVYCHTPHGANPNALGEGAPLWNKSYPASGSFTTYDSSTSSTLDAPEIMAVGSVSIACLSCHDGTQAVDSVINAPGSGLGAVAPNEINTTLTNLAAGIAPNLGTDLSNDHPIGIEYAGGVDATGTLTDPDFAPVATTGTMAAGPWYVDVDTDTVRDKTDMILYTRAFAAGSGPSVECASCHDPHSGSGETGNTAGSDISFMRLASNDQSAVCLACHTK